jgi:hypothetical protein
MKHALLVILCSFLWATSANAQAPFYQGKTIRVIVGTPPGNLYDFWARLIAEHLSKHIPGNPNFVVQNMPGAGHVVAVNFLYTQVKPDGLTLIGSVIPSLYLNQLVGRSEIQFDWSKFDWIGSPARGNSQMYMRSDTPYKTIEDVRTAKEPPKCGATGVTGPDSYFPKLLNETVGAKFNIVTGYRACYIKEKIVRAKRILMESLQCFNIDFIEGTVLACNGLLKRRTLPNYFLRKIIKRAFFIFFAYFLILWNSGIVGFVLVGFIRILHALGFGPGVVLAYIEAFYGR